jgi:uncharacterized RDD family membrane protein YckC
MPPQVAGLVLRGVAFLVDALLAAALHLSFAWALRAFPFVELGPRRWNWFDYLVDQANLYALELAWSLGLFCAALFLVGFLCEALVGRSPGRWLTRTRVVARDGGPAGVGRLLARHLGRALEVPLLGLGAWLAFVLPSRRSLHDLLSGTLVARSGGRVDSLTAPAPRG